jgi:hypothetical protein
MLRPTACMTLLYSLHFLAFAQAPAPAPGLNQKAAHVICSESSCQSSIKVSLFLPRLKWPLFRFCF